MMHIGWRKAGDQMNVANAHNATVFDTVVMATAGELFSHTQTHTHAHIPAPEN